MISGWNIAFSSRMMLYCFQEEPNDQIIYLPERTGRARLPLPKDWGYQYRSPLSKKNLAASEPRVSDAQGQQQVIWINSVK
jgi:hypothetical protein